MRRDGNTTRAIDRFVQEFFTKGFTFVYEGRDSNNSARMREEALFRFKKRMNSEHEGVKFKEELVDEFGVMCYKITKVE